MQVLRWIVGSTLFLALLFLSLQNSDTGDAQVLPLVELAGAAHLRRADRVRDRRRRRTAGGRDALGPAVAPAEPAAPRAAPPRRCAGRGLGAHRTASRAPRRARGRASSRPAALPRAPPKAVASALRPAHGFRAVVAAADPCPVLRAGLDGGADRHQAPAAGIAGAAAVLLPRPQLPAERAAGQGDRIVHRGRQGRSADDRPPLRARQPLPAAGRDRARDAHAPEPARSSQPPRGQARGRAVRAGAGLPSRRPARSRRGALHEARRLAVRARVARLPDLHLRAGEGLAQGDRRHAPHGGDRQAAVLQGDRALLLRARAGASS